MAGNYTESNETSALNNANTTETVVTNVPDDDGYATYDYDYYNVAVVGIFLHVLAIMFCLVSFIFVIYYRTNPIIAKAQPRTYDVWRMTSRQAALFVSVGLF